MTSLPLEARRALLAKRHDAFDVIVRLAQRRLRVALGIELLVERARAGIAQQRSSDQGRIDQRLGQPGADVVLALQLGAASTPPAPERIETKASR